MNSDTTIDVSIDPEMDETLREDSVLDEAEAEKRPHNKFQITSYGADMTVFELTHRLEKDLISGVHSRNVRR